MTVPVWPPAPLEPREVTGALRRLYPQSIYVRSAAGPDGAVLVTLGNPAGRYLGIGRDERVAANLIGRYLRRPVKISGSGYRATAGCCVFSVAPDPYGPQPVDGSLAVPAYTTTAQVLGDFPANQVVTRLISLALDAGCRPHLSPWRSGHGRQYRVNLWHTNPELLFGCIDAGEDSGRFAAAYLQWGTGPEHRYTDPGTVRQNLTSCRDLHHGRSPARAIPPHGLAGALSSAQAPRSTAKPRKRDAWTRAPQSRPGGPR